MCMCFLKENSAISQLSSRKTSLLCHSLKYLVRPEKMNKCIACVFFCQIDLRDDPKTLARLLYMKEKPLTYEHGVKLAKAVPILNFIFSGV